MFFVSFWLIGIVPAEKHFVFIGTKNKFCSEPVSTFIKKTYKLIFNNFIVFGSCIIKYYTL